MADQNPRLDRLAQADLIGEQVALHGVLQDPPHHLYLMGFELDRRGQQGRHPQRRAALRDLRAHEGAAPI